MAFSLKAWKNKGEGNTPLNAVALKDMETRLSAYTDALIITAEKIGALAVTTAKIAEEAITTAKLGSEAVTEAKLASGIKTKLTGAEIIPVGFSVISTVEVRTYRGFYNQIASGETKKLVGMKYSIGEGAKAKFSIKQNGTAISEFKEKEATTSAGEVTGKSVAVTAGDRFDLIVESIETTPKDLIVTLWFESTH